MRIFKADSDGCDGIISSLARKHCVNVMDGDAFSITVSSCESCQSYSLRHIADFENHPHFYARNEPNGWLCCDLHIMESKHSHYSVGSARDGNSNDGPSWMLEESIHYESFVKSFTQPPRSDCDIYYFILH
jgi:hypothetical protein